MGARKPFPAYADETIELFDIISVSAGQRGLQLLLSPRRLPPRRRSHPRRPHQSRSHRRAA